MEERNDDSEPEEGNRRLRLFYYLEYDYFY